MNKLLLSGLSLLFATALNAQSADAAPPNAKPVAPAPVEPIAPTADLLMSTDATLNGAEVVSNHQKYLGAVILSLSPNMQKFTCCLPSILADFVVLGVGFASDYTVRFPFPKMSDADADSGLAFAIYGQSLVLTADWQLAASSVQTLKISAQ